MDNASSLFALFDAWAAAPRGFLPSVTLHDTGDGIVEYAFRLWCSSRQLTIDVVHHDDPAIGEWDVLRTQFNPACSITVHTLTRESAIEPVPGIRMVTS